jgi:hypothetical protein
MDRKNNMDIEIPRGQFLADAFEKIKQQVLAKLNFRGLTVNYRDSVMELPISTIKGCHYEIGFHMDCHEIALHFQGSAENNRSRSEEFRPYLPKLKSDLGYPLILGPHERVGRKRLWIKMPINSLTPELLGLYSDLTARFIILTLPILQAIIDKENHAKNW